MWPDLPGLLPPVSLPSQRCPVSDHLINSMPKHREWGGRPGRSRHMNDVNVCSGTLRVGRVLAISRGFFLECVRALETQMFMKLKMMSSHEINCREVGLVEVDHGSWFCVSWSRKSWSGGSWSRGSWSQGSWSHGHESIPQLDAIKLTISHAGPPPLLSTLTNYRHSIILATISPMPSPSFLAYCKPSKTSLVPPPPHLVKRLRLNRRHRLVSETKLNSLQFADTHARTVSWHWM